MSLHIFPEIKDKVNVRGRTSSFLWRKGVSGFPPESQEAWIHVETTAHVEIQIRGYVTATMIFSRRKRKVNSFQRKLEAWRRICVAMQSVLAICQKVLQKWHSSVWPCEKQVSTTRCNLATLVLGSNAEAAVQKAGNRIRNKIMYQGAAANMAEK